MASDVPAEAVAANPDDRRSFFEITVANRLSGSPLSTVGESGDPEPSARLAATPATAALPPIACGSRCRRTVGGPASATFGGVGSDAVDRGDTPARPARPRRMIVGTLRGGVKAASAPGVVALCVGRLDTPGL